MAGSKPVHERRVSRVQPKSLSPIKSLTTGFDSQQFNGAVVIPRNLK